MAVKKMKRVIRETLPGLKGETFGWMVRPYGETPKQSLYKFRKDADRAAKKLGVSSHPSELVVPVVIYTVRETEKHI